MGHLVGGRRGGIGWPTLGVSGSNGGGGGGDMSGDISGCHHHHYIAIITTFSQISNN